MRFYRKNQAYSRYSWFVGAYASGVYYALSFPTIPDPIVHQTDTDGSYIDHGDEWSERSFSAFIFTCCWYKLRESGTTKFGTESSFGPAEIDKLMRLLDSGSHVVRHDIAAEQPNPFTKEGLFPAMRFKYFFFGSLGMLSVISQNDPAISDTEVRLEMTSPNEPALQAFVSQLNLQGIFTSK